MNLRLYFAIFACAIALLSTNKTANATFLGGVSYSFTFHPAPDERPVYRFGFRVSGDRMLDLQGHTLSLGRFFDLPPDPIEYAWQENGESAYVGGYSGLRGTVTFGANNTITDWDVVSSDWWGEVFRWFQSDPVAFDSDRPVLPYGNGVLPDDGTMLYGINGFEDYSNNSIFWTGFWTEPGRWVTSVNGVTPVPLPSSLILLASGLAGFGLFRRRSERVSA